MVSTSSMSSHPPPDAPSELLSSLKLQVPDGLQVEEMVTFKESEKTNHHRNYISKTTQYSTVLAVSSLLAGVRFNMLQELNDNGRNGFCKATLRDLSPHAMKCFGRTGSTGTTYFGTIYWEVETIIKCFDVLPHDVIDLILAKLSTEDIFRYRSVCKGWHSLTTNPSFWSSFRESTKRRPWFSVLDALTSPRKKNSSSSAIRPEAVSNMEVSALGNRCQFNIKIPTAATTVSTTRALRVDFVSSGGLICSMSETNGIIVRDPYTRASHQLPPLPYSGGVHNIKGIALHISPCSKFQGRLSYQVLVVIVRNRTLRIKSYSSSLNSQELGDWTDKLQLDLADHIRYAWNPETVVVGVTTIGREGNILLHFVNGSGSKSFCCDIHNGTVFMTPMFPQSSRCSKASELIVCDGSLFCVILSDLIRQRLTELQIYLYSSTDESIDDNAAKTWEPFTTMPEDFSTKCGINEKDRDHGISCAGYGNYIMIYVTCASSNYAFMFNIKTRDWILLPPQLSSHTKIGQIMEICSLMPDID